MRVQPDPMREPQFAAFEQWLKRYESADDATKKMLDAEGKLLAQARLTAMADMVQRNTERAVELALPVAVREQLPASMQALIETPVNDAGDFAVMGTLPVYGQPSELPSTFRTATIEEETYHAFTFGQGLRYVTKDNVPLNGFSVPASAATQPPVNPLVKATKILALNPSPVRVLARSGVEAIKHRRSSKKIGSSAAKKSEGKQTAATNDAEPADVLCSVSGNSWLEKNTETAAEVGGKVITFCGTSHLEQWASGAVAAAGLSTPTGASLATAESSYTEGRKRMFLLRPYWSDHAVAMTTNAAITHFNNFSNYMWQMSYGKLRFAALGQGSDISKELLMDGSVSTYSSGLGNGTVWQFARAAASTNGYDLSKYDFVYYVTDGLPSASYCGLGYVGGVGFHLANNCFDAAVSSHEFGHNLDLNHANFWDTALQSMIGAGQNQEYGDNNDPMGGGGNPNQYNSRYKNHLGWISNADITTIPATGSNRYRLYCFDLDYGVGVRGLKFVRSASENYWLQFRQRKTGSAALMNGVQLLWTRNGNESSHLLDVRLRGDAGNNAVVIGRTFSDPNLNFHFTPVGKGNTYPESIDVVAVAGAQPGNLPPTAMLSASTFTLGVGQAATFTATASDPNGDTLAYYWEFGDGAESYSSDNKFTQTHNFASVGEYAVRCVVSDMRGGTAQHTLVVRVGNPAVFRISGHVTDVRSQPMSGALITAGSRSVFADADGSYVIPGLSAGSYTVSALEPLRGAVEFVHPFFGNPVNLGPSAQNIDFIVGTSAPPVTLLATGAIWKYFDSGIDLGTAWRATNYNDATWPSGRSQFGYGEGDETTTNSFGGVPGNKHITYYYRTTFNIANPAVLTNLVVHVLRDDGAAVYLNGVEIFRNNLAAGALYNMLASDNATDDGKTWFTAGVPSSLLMAGANVLAAEVHQDAVDSSDITFDLFLTGESTMNVARATIIYIASPADNAAFTSPTNIMITANAFGAPAIVTNVEIYDGALASVDAAPYTTVLSNPSDGLHVLRAISTDANGLRRTSAPVSITVSAPVDPPLALTLVQTGAVWRYLSGTVAAPAGWQNLNFNDATWTPGTARLGFNSGNTGLGTVINGGPSTARYPTIYFRKTFTVNDPGSVTNLTVLLARDDGAVVYLNGTEILRDNITTGVTPTYAMFATNAADNGSTYFNFTVPADELVPGTNVIAVEVHQATANSSDLAFDLGLSGLASTNRGRGCWLASPAEGSTVPLPGSVTLSAQVVAGGNLAITNVEFYADDVKIGEDAVSPFSFAWSNPPGGAHALVAVAYDSDGASITSAPVSITVLPAPIGDALISFGDVWKYLDDGSNLGTTWRTGAFNDNQWMAGPARFGYGDVENTTVSFGTNAAFKYTSTYFRKKFTVTDPASFNGLLLRLIRDDGAAVYLNGTEVFRANLLAGPVSYNSLALSAIGGSDETTPLDVLLGTAQLVSGINTIAVEMHQDSISSSDLGFDLALIGLRDTNTTDGIYITSPAQGAHYNMPAGIALTAYGSSSSGAITLVEYYDGANKVGQASVAPYSATWNGAAAGAHTLTAVATFGASERMTSPPVAIVVGPAPAPIAPVFTSFIGFGAPWSYWDNAEAVGNGWKELGFDDSAWPVGNARLGWGWDGESTLLNSSRITHYFRKATVVTNAAALDTFFFNVVRDDGVVVYLNGVEVFRTNMPAGTIGASTPPSSSIQTPEETIPVTYALALSGSGLVHGTNVIAAELHQAIESSDAGFDLNLYAEGTTDARVFIGSPANKSIQVVETPIEVTAHARPATGRALTAVEFYSDGTNFGQALAFPYRVTWSGASTGAHTIVARAIDDLGNSITSPPVQITVGHQPVSLVLVPAGSVWNYLDNGSNQGTNWAQKNFDDSGWEAGAAELGYGDLPDGRPEMTVICCSNAAVKSITTYFRRSFVVPPNTFLTNLTFRLLRDDGAVVWLNGREMYRSNMPLTAITYTTAAVNSVGSTDEATFFVTSLATTNTVPGTNVVAVEIHQNSTGSSDVSFNLELEGRGYALASAFPALAAGSMDGQFRVTWPASAAGYQLHWRPQLDNGVWQLVDGSPLITNGFNVLMIPTTNAAGFYRLQKP